MAEQEEFTKIQLLSLEKHNEYRAKHGAAPLKLTKKLCDQATKWATKLGSTGQFEHSDTDDGENIYMTSGKMTEKVGVQATTSWYNEVKLYNFDKQGFVNGTGHFTQVVWQGSTDLGIGVGSGKTGTYVCANYYPAGNMEGDFDENVSRAK